MEDVRITAEAVRSGGWWCVWVPSMPGVLTQTRRVEEIRPMIRDAVALLDGTPPSRCHVESISVQHHREAPDLTKRRPFYGTYETLQRPKRIYRPEN